MRFYRCPLSHKARISPATVLCGNRGGRQSREASGGRAAGPDPFVGLASADSFVSRDTVSRRLGQQNGVRGQGPGRRRRSRFKRSPSPQSQSHRISSASSHAPCLFRRGGATLSHDSSTPRPASDTRTLAARGGAAAASGAASGSPRRASGPRDSGTSGCRGFDGDRRSGGSDRGVT